MSLVNNLGCPVLRTTQLTVKCPPLFWTHGQRTGRVAVRAVETKYHLDLLLITLHHPGLLASAPRKSLVESDCRHLRR